MGSAASGFAQAGRVSVRCASVASAGPRLLPAGCLVLRAARCGNPGVTAASLLAQALSPYCSAPYRTGSQIELVVQANARRVGLPASWIASVIAQESGGRACRHGRAIESPAGAIGIMQLMRPAWAEARQLSDLSSSVDEPSAHIAAGATYLRMMYDRFGYPGLFAAYNAGPGRYAQSLSGKPLPRETENYVRAIVARIQGQGLLMPTSAYPAQTVVLRFSMSTSSERVVGDRDAAIGSLFVLKRCKILTENSRLQYFLCN